MVFDDFLEVGKKALGTSEECDLTYEKLLRSVRPLGSNSNRGKGRRPFPKCTIGKLWR